METNIMIASKTKVHLLCSHIGKFKYSTSSNSSEIINLKNHIRKTQSLEVFRSQFNSTIGSSVSISISDIDCLVRDYQVRPSILTAGLKCLGFSTGVICNSIPSFAQNYIIQGVNHSIQDHLNDSLRDLQTDTNDLNEPSSSSSSSSESYIHESINNTGTSKTQDSDKLYQQLKEDFRETLKFHRDHNYPINENSNKTSEASSSSSSSSTNVVRLALNNLFELTKKF